MAQGALDGVRVIEFGHFLLVPAATTILADWGADVIKIENPKGGDPARLIMTVEGLTLPTEFNLFFQQANRNKRSVALDVMRERGREVLYKLVEKADVFATNFDPRAVERAKADYESLSQINPKLVYLQCTGYGALGPDKHKPGFDYAAFWARSGIMDRISAGDEDPRPQRPGLGDNLASPAVAGAIMAALFARERTGVGQKVEFNLYHFGVWGLSMDIQPALLSEQQRPRTNRRTVPNALWNCYQAKDGKWMMLVMPQTDRWWPRFCKAIGKPELEKAPRFDTHAKRLQENLTLIPMFEEIMASKTSTEWEGIAQEYDLVLGRIQTPLEVVKDPQAWENDFFSEVEHPCGKQVKLIQSPIKFSKTRASVRSAAPELGQNTEEVLLEFGYTWDDISEFKNYGIIM
jgi:crotonobetainyl-CoA:carnitine CoA-transferase CaiB-like acyl-CoA transferase